MPLQTSQSQSTRPNLDSNTVAHDAAQASTTEIPVPTLTGDRSVESEQVPAPAPPFTGGLQFWLIFVALMVSTFLSALDFTSVATALPTIVEHLHGTEFAWVGSAYSLGSTAIMPLVGGLSQVFGRRPVVLGSLVFFALGSGICGGAKNMPMLIGGRTIQGMGGGSIIAVTTIIVGDLVPLSKRGAYMGLIAGLFGSGNIIIIAGTTISIVALTWAGVKYPWLSYKVLVPFISGLAAIALFLVYEAKVAIEPVVPWELVSNRNSFLGYSTVFLHGIVSTAILFYIPVYFQGTLLQSPVKSGVSLFGNAFTIAPGAIVSGVTVAVFGVYRPQNFLGWTLTTTGVGLLSLLKLDSPTGKWIGFQVVEGGGLGILYSAPQFPILSSLPVNKSAHALALLTFVRSYSQTWGVTIGASILQNGLKNKLPAVFLAMFPAEGVEIAYAAIPQVLGLQEPIKTEVRAVFAASLRVIWLTMIGVSGLGLLCVLGMRELKMHEVTDEEWGMKEKNGKQMDVEKDEGKL
ncbi:hypothetical protein FS837_006687 [Tulasnella sp. UAMH 9824]|nr:hypothetical protein FS837_006687 [Tulasnella sp. UAMH 9824]